MRSAPSRPGTPLAAAGADARAGDPARPSLPVEAHDASQAVAAHGRPVDEIIAVRASVIVLGVPPVPPEGSDLLPRLVSPNAQVHQLPARLRCPELPVPPTVECVAALVALDKAPGTGVTDHIPLMGESGALDCRPTLIVAHSITHRLLVT